MRTITANLYTFDELSGKAKEKALRELHSTAEYPWHDENRQTLKAIEKAFKLERFDWGYSEHTHHCSLTVPRDLKQGFNRAKIDLYMKYLEKDNPSICGYYLTEFFKIDLWKSFNQHGDIREALHDAIGSVVKTCQEDMECYFSEESLAEHAMANEIEFTEDGCLA